jgi:hypothetical protein
MSPREPGAIFILGAPRGGTSLLRVMLNRHPNIALCDETFYFFYVYQRRRAFGDLTQPEARRLLIDRYLATNRIRRLGLDTIALAAALLADGTSYDRMFAALLRFYALSHGKKRWGEKTPQHALVAPLLCDWYPHATLIHIVRDPRDVVASLRRMPWGNRSVMLNTRLWERCTAAAEQCRDLPNYLLVRYEDLVQNPELELQRVCNAIGEEYTGQLLAPAEPATTDRWWFERAHQPITSRRRNSWQQELEPRQLALIEHLAAPLMQRFGYQQTGRPPSRLALVAGWHEAAAELLASRVANLPRIWYHWLRPADLATEEALIDRASRKVPRPSDTSD